MTVRALSLACQGGGSHCAFGAGVLIEILSHLDSDGTLERGAQRYRITGVSGTSGGAINALMTWYGLVTGAENGVEALHGFWQDIAARDFSDSVSNYWLVQSLRYRDLIPHVELAPGLVAGWAHEQIRRHLEHRIPFHDLPALAGEDAPKLLVGAAEVLSGKFKVFGSDGELPRVEHYLASSAVPEFYSAVYIDGVPYWDGLLSQNPPVRDFLQGCDLAEKPDEIWLIRINPHSDTHVPKKMGEITDRQNELAGNLSLAQERFFLEQVNNWLARGHLSGPYKRVEWREIELKAENGAGDALDYASKLDRDPAFIEGLIALGRATARRFLHFPD